jgi:hypothetical protein
MASRKATLKITCTYRVGLVDIVFNASANGSEGVQLQVCVSVNVCLSSFCKEKWAYGVLKSMSMSIIPSVTFEPIDRFSLNLV